MVMDSLRYWVQVMGVDGFRFDLATTLARVEGPYDEHASFLDAVAQDPVLGQVKLIAEPWDTGLGGYQVGNFPPGWAEWNDQYRDTMRKFWKGRRRTARRFCRPFFRLRGHLQPPRSTHLGQRQFHHGPRRLHPARPGQLQREAQRSQRRGRPGRLGQQQFLELRRGRRDRRPGILALRRRQMRNFLATLLLSQGTPMLLAGDEFAHPGRQQQRLLPGQRNQLD
jgi:isoamylase